MPISHRESGFTLIEVSVAASLVVMFALAFATSFGVAFGATRGNLLRQQATAVVNEEVEHVRSLAWPEVAMSSVDAAAPMLDATDTALLGSEAGFAGTEVLAVFPLTGAVHPWGTHEVDGQSYTVWRYVTHAGSGLRRFVVLVTWIGETAAETLLSSTLVSEVTARQNPGGVTTTTTTTTTSTTTTTLLGSPG
ncbi:MAG TPA: type II secretion system protein [Acidimicrobiia bacterium]|nr:type II secretion system protein [Acidimicrobiia bacterium]